jgi:cellulose biosynthesis protein BcsQ
MSARVICMASAKGGTGKTVLTATFGTFLTGIGKKVLLIDTDAATNGLTLLYLKEVMIQEEAAISVDRIPRGIFEEPSAANPPEIVALKAGIDLLPATYGFVNTEQVGVDQFRIALQYTLSFVRDAYDFVFLDAQSGADGFGQYCMKRGISDEVILVSEYDPMSAAGIERLKGLFREDLTYIRTWVLLNKMLPDFVQSFSDFLEVAKYLTPIPWDADVVKAYARRRLALDMEHGNAYTLAVMQTLRTLLTDSIASEINIWKKSREAAIRQPVFFQYQDLEHELQDLVSQRSIVNLSLRARRIIERLKNLLIVFVPIGVACTILGSFPPSFVAPYSEFLRLVGYGIVITSGLALGMMQYFEPKAGKLESEMEDRRLRRRQMVVEEQLKKLEVMKSADFEELMRHNRSQS